MCVCVRVHVRVRGCVFLERMSIACIRFSMEFMKICSLVSFEETGLPPSVKVTLSFGTQWWILRPGFHLLEEGGG